MIITITPNPSIDVSYYMEEFQLDAVNRCYDYNKTAGGKGLNVSKVLKIIGGDLLATGFAGGKSGEFIEEGLKERNIKSCFIKIAGETRTSLAIQHEDTSTEIREAGPTISTEEEQEFLDLLKDLAEKADTFCISGSLPLGLDYSFMEKVLDITKDKKLIVDTSGENLRKIVFESTIKPYAVKPNLDEIMELTGLKKEELKIEEILKGDVFKDIPLVMVSLGKEGAVAKYKDSLYRMTVPVIEAVNSVGSGDSTIAGLAYGISRQLEIKETFKLAMSLGVLNALEKEIGYININHLEAMKEKIKVEEII
ncbi:1-phosphofructokinase family hexose kinase [Gallicola sp. Sow4_E12]|uniref:1-phosphofructokinase family hexose kinase n=1 Tax=Gallicola sp. Sow4_E12 TaxID=3438785 RepID=UPI003F91A34F